MWPSVSWPGEAEFSPPWTRALAERPRACDHGASFVFACRTTTIGGVTVSDDNVIPFRKRPPSEAELEVYRRMTQKWSPALRELFFPEHFRLLRQEEERVGE